MKPNIFGSKTILAAIAAFSLTACGGGGGGNDGGGFVDNQARIAEACGGCPPTASYIKSTGSAVVRDANPNNYGGNEGTVETDFYVFIDERNTLNINGSRDAEDPTVAVANDLTDETSGGIEFAATTRNIADGPTVINTELTEGRAAFTTAHVTYGGIGTGWVTTGSGDDLVGRTYLTRRTLDVDHSTNTLTATARDVRANPNGGTIGTNGGDVALPTNDDLRGEYSLDESDRSWRRQLGNEDGGTIEMDSRFATGTFINNLDDERRVLESFVAREGVSASNIHWNDSAFQSDAGEGS